MYSNGSCPDGCKDEWTGSACQYRGQWLQRNEISNAVLVSLVELLILNFVFNYYDNLFLHWMIWSESFGGQVRAITKVLFIDCTIKLYT